MYICFNFIQTEISLFLCIKKYIIQNWWNQKEFFSHMFLPIIWGIYSHIYQGNVQVNVFWLKLMSTVSTVNLIVSRIIVETFTLQINISNLAEMFILTYSLIKNMAPLEINPWCMLAPWKRAMNTSYIFIFSPSESIPTKFGIWT